jgi:hypothetical protein
MNGKSRMVKLLTVQYKKKSKNLYLYLIQFALNMSTENLTEKQTLYKEELQLAPGIGLWSEIKNSDILQGHHFSTKGLDPMVESEEFFTVGQGSIP